MELGTALKILNSVEKLVPALHYYPVETSYNLNSPLLFSLITFVYNIYIFRHHIDYRDHSDQGHCTY